MSAASTRQLLTTFVPAVFILVAIAATSLLFHVKMPDMTRDVTAIAHIHALSGILSSLGILLWSATASICGFTAVTLVKIKSRETFWFLMCSALLSAYLLIDDLFLFHEALGPRYFGLNEHAIFAALGVAVFAYLFEFRRVIWHTHFGVLLLALGFLSTSVVIDTLLQRWWQLGDWEYFFEDGANDCVAIFCET